MSAFVSPRHRSRALLAGSVAALLFLAACSSGDGDTLGGEVVSDGLGCTVSEVDRRVDDPPIVPAEVEVGAEATTEDLIEAEEDACSPSAQQYLTLDMVGATVSDGTEFVNTFGDGNPITALLGQGQLIAGLETTLVGMPVGTRRQVVVPAALAYGPEGSEAQGIEPDEDLVLVVDLVAATDAPQYCNEAAPVAPGIREGKPTEVALPAEPLTDEVVTTVLVEGDGPEATPVSYVTVDYLGVSCATGLQFDSSWDRDETITAALVDAEPTATRVLSVIPGWTEGMLGQKQGSTVQIDIPAEQAYGSTGSPPVIGPNDPLTFIVSIIEVSDEPPADPTLEEDPAAGN